MMRYDLPPWSIVYHRPLLQSLCIFVVISLSKRFITISLLSKGYFLCYLETGLKAVDLNRSLNRLSGIRQWKRGDRPLRLLISFVKGLLESYRKKRRDM